MTSLTSLEAGGTQIKDLTPLSSLHNLTRLQLANCDRLENLNPLSELVNLKELNLIGCHRLKSLQPIRNLKKLESLELSVMQNEGHGMDLINQLPSLNRLRLQRCMLKRIDFLDSRCTIRHLMICNSNSLMDLSGLNKLSKLRTLYLDQCNALESLKGIGTPPSLRYIRVVSCSKFRSLAGAENLAALSEIRVKSAAVSSEELNRFRKRRPTVRLDY